MTGCVGTGEQLEHSLLTKCPEPVLPTPTGELVQMQLLTQQVCGGTQDSAFLTNLQAMKMLLVQEHFAANISCAPAGLP